MKNIFFILYILIVAVGYSTNSVAMSEDYSCLISPKPSVFSEENKEGIMRIINNYRELSDLDALQWDEKLAQYAQGWAEAYLINRKNNEDTTPYSYGSCYQKVNSEFIGIDRYGEGIIMNPILTCSFMAYCKENIIDVFNEFSFHIIYPNSHKASCRKGFENDCNNYLNLVNSRAKKIGCGIQGIRDENITSSIIVCIYDAAHSITIQYE